MINLTNQHYSDFANLLYPKISMLDSFEAVLAVLPKRIVKHSTVLSNYEQFIKLIDNKLVIEGLPEYSCSENHLFQYIVKISAPKKPFLHYLKKEFNVDVFNILQLCIEEKQVNLSTSLAQFLFAYFKENKDIINTEEQDNTMRQIVNGLLCREKMGISTENNQLRLDMASFISEKIENLIDNPLLSIEKKREWNDWFISSLNSMLCQEFPRTKLFYQLENKLAEQLNTLDYSRVEASLEVLKLINGNQCSYTQHTQALLWKIDYSKFNYQHNLSQSYIHMNLQTVSQYIEDKLSHHSDIEQYNFTTGNGKAQILILYKNSTIAHHIKNFIEYVCTQTAQNIRIHDKEVEALYLSYKLNAEMNIKPHGKKMKL